MMAAIAIARSKGKEDIVNILLDFQHKVYNHLLSIELIASSKLDVEHDAKQACASHLIQACVVSVKDDINDLEQKLIPLLKSLIPKQS